MSRTPTVNRTRNPKPSPGDYANAIQNICRERRVDAKEAEAAFSPDYNFYNALRRIDAQRRQLQEAEEQRAQALQEAQLQRDFQQVVLMTRYQSEILPALRVGLHLSERFNPLANPGDTTLLMDALLERRVQIDPQRNGEQTKVRLQKQQGSGWQTGIGVGDSISEALVLAWWNGFGEEYAGL